MFPTQEVCFWRPSQGPLAQPDPSIASISALTNIVAPHSQGKNIWVKQNESGVLGSSPDSATDLKTRSLTIHICYLH